MVQFSLLSLIPELLKNLRDAGDPGLNNYEETLKKPTSVKTSDRKSREFCCLELKKAHKLIRRCSACFHGTSAPDFRKG